MAKLPSQFRTGIHPEIRRLCRDAARAINRYPVKDPLPFDTDEEELEDDLEDADEVDDTEETETEELDDEFSQLEKL